MAEESPTYPLAPARIHQRSDEEFAPLKTHQAKQTQPSKCFVYILCFIVFQTFLILAFSLIVFRVDSPKIKLTPPFEIRNLKYNTTSRVPSLNFTMTAQVTIKNNNFGRFKFEKSDTSLLLGNVSIGIGEINSGSVRARATERVNVTLTVRSNSGILGNLSTSGTTLVNMRSYAELRGTLHVLKIMNKRKTPKLNCTMSLNLTSQVFQDLQCT